MVKTKFRQGLLSGIVSVICLSTVLFSWSCSDAPVSAPEMTNNEVIQTSEMVVPLMRKMKPVGPVKKSGRLSKFDGTGISKVISAKRGGKIGYLGHAIGVPPGAVSDDTEFSITIKSTQYMDIEFGPDGAFDVPVELTISYADADLSGISEDDLTIAWYDPASGIYYDIGAAIDKRNKVLKVLVKHFTQYSLSVR